MRSDPTDPQANDDPSRARSLDPRVGWLLLAVLVLAGLLRLTYLLELSRAPDFESPRFESLYHDYWARALRTGDWTAPAGVTDPEIPDRPYFRPPGYPYFLAAAQGLLGDSAVSPRMAQMLLGVVTCWLLFLLACRWFGDVAALAAAALYGVAWVPIFFEGELMAPPLLVALLVGHWLALARWWQAQGTAGKNPKEDDRGTTWALLAGLSLGAAALVRPNALALIAPTLLWMVWVLRRRAVPLLRSARPLVVVTLAMALAVAPATLRNRLVSGTWVLVTSNAGINLFVGTHPDGDGFTPGVPELSELLGLDGWDSFDQPKIVAAVSSHEGRALDDREVSQWFSQRALAHLRDDPGAVVSQMARKLLLFWGPAEISNNKVLELERRHSPTLGMGIGFATLLAFALGGLAVLAWERRARLDATPAVDPAARLEGAVLLLAALAVTCASYLPFFVAARFRHAVLPVLAIFGGVAIAGLWSLGSRRRGSGLGALAALLIVLRGVTGVAWIPYESDEALWHLRRGLLFREQERFDEATSAFGAVLAVDPEHPDAPLLLGETLTADQRPQEAMAVYQRALATPSTADRQAALYNNLALLQARGGDLDGAIGSWQQALARDPDRVATLVNLAGALATHPDPASRRPDQAVELAQRAVELSGGHPNALAVLEVAKAALGEETAQ